MRELKPLPDGQYNLEQFVGTFALEEIEYKFEQALEEELKRTLKGRAEVPEPLINDTEGAWRLKNAIRNMLTNMVVRVDDNRVTIHYFWEG